MNRICNFSNFKAISALSNNGVRAPLRRCYVQSGIFQLSAYNRVGNAKPMQPISSFNKKLGVPFEGKEYRGGSTFLASKLASSLIGVFAQGDFI